MINKPQTPPDYLSIAVRTYADHGNLKPRKQVPHIPSDYALIFDCETSTDAAQALRFGSFQLRKHNELIEEGFFYDAVTLIGGELELLKTYAAQHDLALMTTNKFIDDYFYGYGYDLGATIIGFNLPFDISRLAKGWGPARRAMKGGFTLPLSTDKQAECNDKTYQ